jgi:hypothetical protein
VHLLGHVHMFFFVLHINLRIFLISSDFHANKSCSDSCSLVDKLSPSTLVLEIYGVRLKVMQNFSTRRFMLLRL